MSNNNPQVSSSVGRINYRAVTIPEAKLIITEAIKKGVEEALGKNKPLTFHAFRFRWGFKMEALAGTPVPSEIDKWFTAVAPEISDEELDALQDNIEKLKEKRKELQTVIETAAKIDAYLRKAEVQFVEVGEEDDKRTPDMLRQKYGLPIMQVKQEGVQMIEAPISNPQATVTTPETTNIGYISEVADYSPAEGLAESYSEDGGGTPKTEMEQNTQQDEKEGIKLSV